MAAIYGSDKVVSQDFLDNTSEKSIEVKSSIRKPMPVLKLNLNNPDDSKFIASHQSHRSHSSHRSHYSHRSYAG
jgi:hypothetical protein